MKHHGSLNRAYRLVWSQVKNAWVVASEITKGSGKSSGKSLLASVLLLLPLFGHASPLGGMVTSGTGTINQAGSVTTITQSSQNLSINWKSFNIGSQETVNFLQPSASAIAVNRIFDTNGTTILGHLNANGQIYLINPNGILFGQGAQVNVGGLVASTLDSISNNGNTVSFSGNGTGKIINEGTIAGHYVALIGNSVSNTGTITANLGSAALGAGSSVSLTFSGNDLVHMQVDKGVLNALVANGGIIQADGGYIIMTAGAKDELLSSVVNNTGIVRAQTVQSHNGTITLLGGMSAGQVNVSGTLDASAPNGGNGGQIVATANSVSVVSEAKLDASGKSGGGIIDVGGSLHGSDPNVSNATTTFVDPNATLSASATDNGNGGIIAIWSDVATLNSTTRVYGTLLATGGANGGDGGIIETSGHWLDVSGIHVSASSSKGNPGQWLLDPYNVIIGSSSSGDPYSQPNFSPSTQDSTILASDIANALSGGSNVTITTGSSGSSMGDITVNSAITKASGNTDVTLTLQAADSIIVNQAISDTGGTGKLNVTLLADNDNGVHDGVGIIMLNNSIATGGGNIQFGDGSTLSINGVNTMVGGDVYVGGTSAVNLTTNGGAVTVNGQMLIANTNGLNINTSNGNVSFGGLLDSGNTYSFVTSSNITWSSALSGAATGTQGSVGSTYLATITSRLENAMASYTASYQQSWLGAARLITGQVPDSSFSCTNGLCNTWYWVAGPLGLANGGAGTPFFTQNGTTTQNGQSGTAINGAYTNWNPGTSLAPGNLGSAGEPNNGGSGTNLSTSGAGEWVMQFVGNQGQWNDLNPTNTSGIAGYVKETNLATSPLTVNAGTGTVTFAGAVGSNKALASLNVTAVTVAVNGGSVTTEGTQTYNGNMTLGSSSTTLSQTNANTDFTLQSNDSISNATSSLASLTVKTTGNILLDSGSSISSSVGALNVTLNSDSDATNGGAIWLQGNGTTGASITTNGGNLTLSGGTNVATGYAQGDTTISNGVSLDTATLNSGGGNIVIRGKGAASASTYSTSEGSNSSNNNGIRLYSGNTINSGTGTIDIEGVAIGTGSGASNGIETNTAGYSKILSAATNTTAITLFGDASVGTNTGNGWGTFLWGGNSSGIVIATTGAGGGISLNGKGNNFATGAGGTHMEPNAYVLAASGPISITGTAGTTSIYSDVDINSTIGFIGSLPAGFGMSSPVTSSSSNISITADTLSANHVFGSGTFSGSAVQSSGILAIAPRTTGKAMAVQTTMPGIGTSWINPSSLFGNSGLFKTGFSSLVFGSSTTGNVTLDNYTFDNPTVLNTGGNAVLGAIDIANNALTVNMTGSGSITETGAVAVSQLDLNGSTSAVTLTNSGNAIGTLAADVASLYLVNGGALSIGTVGSVNGVTSSGSVDIETQTGNLTVSKNIITSDAGTSAIVLDAARNTAAGTSTSGDVVLNDSPSISMGTGGRALIYTGSISGSTGVAALVGSGSGNFRYDSNAGTTSFSDALGSSGIYAIYREQPTINITAQNDGINFSGAAFSGGNGVVYSGFVNGDTSAILTGTLVYGGSCQGASAAGTYSIIPEGLGNGLGYAMNYVNGVLTIDSTQSTSPATVSSNSAQNVITQILSSSGGQSLAGQGNNPISSEANPDLPSASTTIAAPPNSASEPGSGNTSGNSSSNGNGVIENVTLPIGGTGSLQIVNGGLRLPDNMVGSNSWQGETIYLNHSQIRQVR